MATYFFYGTLCDPEIAREILGRPLSGCSPSRCELPGHRRVYVTGTTYPAIAEDEESSVDGLVVYRISPLEEARLKRYEGPQYSIVELDVVLRDGERETANVFIPKESLRLSNRAWELDVWRRHEKRRFMNGLRRNVLI